MSTLKLCELVNIGMSFDQNLKR